MQIQIDDRDDDSIFERLRSSMFDFDSTFFTIIRYVMIF